MRALSPAEPAPATARHDPAPSRLAYRLQRLLLTPLIRGLLRLGLPVFVAILVAGVLISDAERRQDFADWAMGIRDMVVNRPEFLVQGMSIDGASPVLAEAIRDTVAIDWPRSSFDLDLEQMRQEIMKLDPVAEARLQVGAQGILRVAIVERTPVVLWRGPEGLELLDPEGYHVADAAHRGDRADLPLIVGTGAPDSLKEALSVLAAAQPLADRIRGLLRVGKRRWDIVLDRNQRIQLPEDRPVAALEQVLALHQAQDILDRDIAVIDMRNPRRPTLRLTPGATEDLRNIRSTKAGATRE